MDKKKKIILISVIAIVIVIAIVVLSVYFVNKNKTNTDNNSASTKVEKLYNTLTDKKEYSFSFTLDDKISYIMQNQEIQHIQIQHIMEVNLNML